MSASRVWIRRGFTACALARLVALFVLLGLLKPIVSFERLARWAGRPAKRNRTPPEDISQVAGRVLRAGRLSGIPDRDCLQRSLLLYRELSRNGCRPTLVVGMRREQGALDAHAWVIVHGRVVGEEPDPLAEFVPAFRVTEHGKIVAAEAA
jgi:hypothetical protein